MKPYVLVGPEVRTLISNTTGLEIPVIAARGLVFSAWTPEPEDIKRLAAGEPLWLVQRGEAIPEMHMVVGRKDAVVPEPVKNEAAAMRSPAVQREAAIEIATRKYAPMVERAMWAVLIVAVVAFVTYAIVQLSRHDWPALQPVTTAPATFHPYQVR